MAGPSARPTGPGHGGHDRGGDPRQVHRFYKRHYVPGNFVVAAAGNVRHDDVLSLLATRMETGRALPEGDDSTWNLRSAGHPPSPSGKRLVRRRKTEQAHICLGTNGLARTDPDRFAFLVVNTALGGGMSSRLFQEIRERRGLAYSVYSYHSQYTEAGLFTTYAGTTPARAEQVIDLIRRELDDVASGGLTEEEFDRAKRPREGVARPRARGSGRTHVASGQVRDRARRDPVGEPDARRIEHVTLEDARRVAERVLSQPMTLTVLGPFAGGAFKEVIA